MSIERTTKDVVVMSDRHLKDARLSWKAKGILSVMLSSPENRDCSIEWLASTSKNGKSSVRSGLKELEEQGYLKRQPVREHGKFAYWEYRIL